MKTFIPRRIKELRTEKGITQSQIARQVEPPTNRETVGNWEKGYSKIPAPRLGQVASILGVPVDFFFSDNDRKTDPSNIPQDNKKVS